MKDYAEKIAKLEARLVSVNKTIEKYEATAKRAGGHVSEPFTYHLNEATQQRDRLTGKIHALKQEAASHFSPVDPDTGLLQICDEIGDRLEEAFRNLDRHTP